MTAAAVSFVPTGGAQGNTPPTGGAQGNALFAWELGGGLGHVAKGLLLAGQLAVADIPVSFAVRDLAGSHPLLSDASHRLFQAPVGWLRLRDAPEPASYADLLLHAGYGDTRTLKGLVRGWLTVFEADDTRLVIADHAPSAVLAARVAGLPAVRFGHGFLAPPPGWPRYRRDATASGATNRALHERDARSGNHVLHALNDCLTSFGAETLQRASDLFAGTENFLCTWPELDHYPDRGPSDPPDTFVGTLWVDTVGDPPMWPAPDGNDARRVFAYLRPELPGLGDVLGALQQSGASVLVAAPGLAPEVARRWRGPRLQFAPGLVALRDVAREADLVVCSGSDTLHGLAQSGVPVLGLPLNAEQRLAAERVAALDAGRWLLPGSPAPALQAALGDLLGSPGYRAAARRLLQRHPRRDADVQLAPVVTACRRLLAGRRPDGAD